MERNNLLLICIIFNIIVKLPIYVSLNRNWSHNNEQLHNGKRKNTNFTEEERDKHAKHTHTDLLREAHIKAQEERGDPPPVTQAQYSKHVRSTHY